MRPAAILFSLAVFVCPAQTPTRDVAEPPSDRFPVRWYPADNVNATTEPPVKGIPYSATMVTIYHHPADRNGETSTRISDAWYRDGQGRTRTEQTTHGMYRGTDGAMQDYERRTIGVNDPVSHCSFDWTEPWKAEGEPVAVVRCSSRIISYTPTDHFAWIVAQKAGNDKQARYEPLGHRTIDGFDTVGARSVRTATVNGTTTEYVYEFWYAPKLHELLRSGATSSEMPGSPTFELHDVHLGEPQSSLFYPLANYRIVKQGDPVR